MPVIETPFNRIAIDIIGPLPKTEEGHNYILTVVDFTTRYPETMALIEITAEAVANALSQYTVDLEFHLKFSRTKDDNLRLSA